jgi:hypothetical protein
MALITITENYLTNSFRVMGNRHPLSLINSKSLRVMGRRDPGQKVHQYIFLNATLAGGCEI